MPTVTGRLGPRLGLAAWIVSGCGDRTVYVQPHYDVSADAYVVPMDSRIWPEDVADRHLLQTWKQRLSDARLAWVIGSEDHSPDYQFGSISAASTHNDQVFVSDFVYRQVRVYDDRGLIQFAIAGPDSGLFTMRGVIGIAHGPEGQIVLADPARINVASLAEGNAEREVATIEFERTLTGVCTVGPHIFARLLDPYGMEEVGIADIVGETTAAFGRPVAAVNHDLDFLWYRGKVACFGEPQRVVVSYDNIPILRGYTSDGVIVWETILAGFVPGTWMRYRLGKLPAQQKSRRHRADHVQSVLAIQPDVLLVQVIRWLPDTGATERDNHVDSYLLLSGTGVGAYIGRGLPLIRAISGSRYYTAQILEAGQEQLSAFDF